MFIAEEIQRFEKNNFILRLWFFFCKHQLYSYQVATWGISYDPLKSLGFLQVGILTTLGPILPLQLWGPITLCENLWLRWGLKQSCSPCQKLFNSVSYATYTQGNWVDSWLLMVESQIANLTPNPSFGHNLCFKCRNGSCELTLDI
jgi:hypothetical protein